MCRACNAPNRRQILALLAAAPLLSACKPQTEGPEPIRWGREFCEVCGMIISEPQFAAEIRDPDDRLYKFDDIGDAVNWLDLQPWREAPDLEIWVMDYDSGHAGDQWLDARSAQYRTGVISPMDYGFGAVRLPASDTVDYETMRKAVLERGLTSRCDPEDHAARG